MNANLPTATPDSEWATIRAADLAVGNQLAGDQLPLGQPGEILFTRLFERNRSEWMFVAFAQWDGFHDSTTFLASAPVRVRIVEPVSVEDPTEFHCPGSIAFGPNSRSVCGTDGTHGPHGYGQLLDPTGLAYSRADDGADDPTPVSGARVAPHNGAMTEQGLVDETPAEVHMIFALGGTFCGFDRADHLTSLIWREVTCKRCLDRVAEQVAEQVDD